MVHIFLLVSLFSPMSVPSDTQSKDTLSPEIQIGGLNKSNTFVEVRFNKTPQVTVGDPVMFNGNVVGSISRVEQAEAAKGATNVSIRLLQEGMPMNDSLVALVGSVKMNAGVHSHKGKQLNSVSRSFLELMSFNSGGQKEASYVKGFTSFQEFWTSPSSI